MKIHDFFINNDWHECTDLLPFLKSNKEWLFQQCTTSNKKEKIYDIPCSFDIEVSSFVLNETKYATMYIWQFSINGYAFFGRTWVDYINFIDTLSAFLKTNDTMLIVYVHNLAYEFQFFKNLFEWKKVFALKKRKPLSVTTIDNVNYRCSYLLLGYSLANIPNTLIGFSNLCKKIGDIDYRKIRHSKTPLTHKEMQYCINDVNVITAVIWNKIVKEGSLCYIPLTKTGYVRNHCRKKCYDNTIPHGFSKYRKLMKSMILTPDDYTQLKRAFQGGFTHANWTKVDNVIKNVESYDLRSGYPANMVMEKFPMSSAENVTIIDMSDFKNKLKSYCCLFDIRFFGLKPVIDTDHPLSVSKCWEIEGYVADNGRVYTAEMATLTCTEIDFLIYSNFYEWDKMEISNFKIFKKGYLPKNLILAILEIYVNKCELKNVEGRELDYLISKEYINSIYGMTVTDICKPDIIFKNGTWSPSDPPDIEGLLEKYNNSANRFQFYPWGVWVTAYTRLNLFALIKEVGNDYIYSDTDSVKFEKNASHDEFFEKYNNMLDYKINKVCDFYNISPKKFAPLNLKIGEWDNEGTASRFKTLGAKRYLVEKNNKHYLTVAGISKIKGVQFFSTQAEKTNTDIFDVFSINAIVSKEYSGKLTATYIDTPYNGVVTDYLGSTHVFSEQSGVYMENSEYELSRGLEFIRFLGGLTSMNGDDLI